jgi:hypothetical protein
MISIVNLISEMYVDLDKAVKLLDQSLAGYSKESERGMTAGEKRSVTAKATAARRKLERVLGFDIGNLPNLTPEQKKIKQDLYNKLSEFRKEKENLSEVSVTPKDVYKTGTQHELYKDHKDPDKIYRVVKPGHQDISKQAYNWVKVFQEYPQYFPKVYKATDRGASVEKLDANKASKEFFDIHEVIKKEFGLKMNWFVDVLKDIAEGDYDSELVHRIGVYLQQEHPQLASAFKRYTSLMHRLQVVNNSEYTLDAHSGNFGYDKQGHLKMLDL